MRRFALSNKKLRGRRRRLRSLARWADSFRGRFPPEAEWREGWWFIRLPISSSLVEGPQATHATRRSCMQQLLRVWEHLQAARPSESAEFRLLVSVCLPNLFDSDVTLIADKNFRSHTRPSASRNGESFRITGRSLAEDWRLRLPAGCGELGIGYRCAPLEPGDRERRGEVWYFGDVGDLTDQHAPVADGP